MRLQSGVHLDPKRPFSRADARAYGIGLRELLSTRYQRVLYDIYVSAGVRPSVLLRCAAALSVAAPGTYVSHVTAATIWGATVPHSDAVHVSVPGGGPRSERRGVKAHRATAGVVVRNHEGILISDVPSCLFEMAGDGVGLIDLVVAADSLIKIGRLTVEEFASAAKRWSSRGAKLARRAASLARQGVDSAMESRLRLLLVLAGLPEPEVNVILRDSDGKWSMRFDLCYRELKLIIEYDGRQHAESTKQWKRDSRRREALDRMGWRVIVVDRDDLYVNPGETLDRICDVIQQRTGRRPRLAGSAEWRRHFPGRDQAA